MNCKEIHSDSAEKKGKKWFALSMILLLVIIFAGISDIFLAGIPLDIVMPIIRVKATISIITYYVFVLSIAIYIWIIGIKELILEKRFSVEFLMSLAAIGAIYLQFFFEAAIVLFLYSLAEYLESYIQKGAKNRWENVPTYARTNTSNKKFIGTYGRC